VNKSKLSDDTDDGFDGWKHKDEKGNHTTKPGYDKGLNDYSLFKDLFLKTKKNRRENRK
jgi:hypothetical protein